jgi:hypothetical protein
VTAVAPPDVIQAPVLAAAPPLSLVAAARTPTLGAGVRWEAGGVTYAPENCADHGVLDPCSNPGGFGSPQPNNLPPVVSRPFTIWAADECSSFGFAARDWEGRALRQLEAATPWEVEREFWRGALAGATGTEGAGNRFLSDAMHLTDITPGSGAVSVVDGVACLEQALGDTGHGGQGMIHVTRKVVIALDVSGMLHRVGNTLMSPVDTVVVPGVGYPGTGPSLPPPSTLVATPGTDPGSSLADGNYQYVVTATNAAGETTASVVVNAQVVAGGTGQVALDWDDVAGATGYRVFRLVGPDFELFGTPAVSNFTDTGAAPINTNQPPAVNTTGDLPEGEHYIYATDYVTVLLGNPKTRMAGESGLATQYGVLDPGVNTLRYRAERMAAVGFDGCRHFGIKVNVPVCGGSI